MASLFSSGRERLSSIEVNRPKTELSGGIHRRYAAGDTIFEPNGDTSRILFLVSGWAICSKVLNNGTRIVVDFSLRNDMISTMSADLAQETIHAVSEVTAYELPDFMAGGRWEVSPKLYRIVLNNMMMRQARMSERLANIGRRDALERTGHLLLELAIRAGSPVPKQGFDGFKCPLTQSDIGDAVGLSTVHINRVLKDMRLGGLLSFRNGIVEFLDRGRLAELVDFDPGYFEPQDL